MSTQVKTRSDDTRARIIETAEALFRRMGFAKTAVADIASELGMSPANIYRFFASKNAIVDAICQRCLGELDEKAWSVARGRGTAGARIEQLVLAILAYHKENLITEQRVHDMVLVAIEQNWEAILAHKQAIQSAIELIIRDGIEAGEFEKVEPRPTSLLLMQSLIRYCHPVLIADSLREHDLEAEAREHIRFLLRAISSHR
ncbi:MAG TPA: TetR/AcrR family transcriptional regulator [Xanthobacteraceae bacterium]|nr:TetR/AcrR family transcriptional regulator [Xanthobacteraceae bacterium]